MGSGVTWEKEEDELLTRSWFAANEDSIAVTPTRKKVITFGIEHVLNETLEKFFEENPVPTYITATFIIIVLIASCIHCNRPKHSSTATSNGTDTN